MPFGGRWNAKTKSFVFGHIAEISPQESGGSNRTDGPRLFCLTKIAPRRHPRGTWKDTGGIQEAPESTQEAPRRHQEAPRGIQEAPGGIQE